VFTAQVHEPENVWIINEVKKHISNPRVFHELCGGNTTKSRTWLTVQFSGNLHGNTMIEFMVDACTTQRLFDSLLQ
jgi:hypothetical protein